MPSGRIFAGRSQANPARMQRIRPAHRARTAETSISRIRIVPEAGDRAWKAAASRFRLIAAAVRQDWIFMLPSPRRTARRNPCWVFVSPWKPSDRQKWRL